MPVPHFSVRTHSIVIGGLLLAAASSAAQAAVSFNITGNEATVETTTYAPPETITPSTFSAPYGTAVVVTTGNNLAITFTPSALFKALADNSTGGQTTHLDGKLDFNIDFTTAQVLNATITEGGNFTTSNTGTTSVIAGLDITNTDDSTVFGGNLVNTFNAGTHVWSSTLTTSNSLQPHLHYHFSIDNALVAEALADLNPSTAAITKTSFTIQITTGGGAVPEPASLILLAFAGSPLLLRRPRRS